MIAFTSAKSRLMMPGTVMMSEMPCTAWRKMSSAMRNASKKLVPRSTVSIRRSLGITITVSTAPIKSCSACSACIMRRLPSNANGFVTTATVSAPSSLASEATTGAAPEPVPPPRPDVMKIMSEPSSASIILSVSSSAALRPTSGLAPAPRPFVSFAPSCNFTGACESFSACKSVFAVMNSTPSTLARIIRLTALQPPPPTPITFIFAGDSSSLKLMRMPASFAIIVPPISGWKTVCEVLLKKLRETFSNKTARLSPYAAPGIKRRPLQQISGSGEHRLQLRDDAGAGRRIAPRFCSVQNQSNRRRVFRLRDLLRQIVNSFWLRDAYRQVKNLLGHFVEAVQARAAARKNKTRRNLFQQTGALEVVANQYNEFLRARFDNFREHPRENRPRRPVANAGDLDRRILVQKCSCGAAVMALDALGFRNRRA